MKVKVISAFCQGPGVNRMEGDVLEIPRDMSRREAELKIRQRHLLVIEPDAAGTSTEATGKQPAGGKGRGGKQPAGGKPQGGKDKEE